MWRAEQVSKITINADDLHSEVMRILSDYGEEGSRAVSLAVEDEASEIRNKIRSEAKSAGVKGSGRYKGGWQIKKSYSHYGRQCTIYNGVVPGLAHLLENGHRVVVRGKTVGQAKAYPHIAKATEGMESDLLDKIKSNLGN